MKRLALFALAIVASVQLTAAPTAVEITLSKADAAWLNTIYEDLLGRQPTRGEIAAAVDMFHAGGAGRKGIATKLVNSTEYRKALWDRMAIQFTGGVIPADAESLNFTNMLSKLFTSDQYFRKAGGNEQYVKQLYTDLLGRAPSDGELNFAVKLLGEKGRAAVFHDISVKGGMLLPAVQKMSNSFFSWGMHGAGGGGGAGRTSMGDGSVRTLNFTNQLGQVMKTGDGAGAENALIALLSSPQYAN